MPLTMDMHGQSRIIYHLYSYSLGVKGSNHAFQVHQIPGTSPSAFLKDGSPRLDLWHHMMASTLGQVSIPLKKRK